MTETKIDISELKTEDSDLVKELAKFLEEKTNTQIETGTSTITIKDEESAIPRGHLRVLLKKFLHNQELKEHFRIIGGKDNTLIVKEKKVEEEEE